MKEQSTESEPKLMTHQESISVHGQALLQRRSFLQNSGLTMGGLSLLQLLADDQLLAGDNAHRTTGAIRPAVDPENPYRPRASHFDAPAKQVLIIYLPGAISHLDTFDYKPELIRLHGQKPPNVPAVTFNGPTGNIAKPFWEFRPRGQRGMMVSDLVPHLGELVDDFCFFHALTTPTPSHPTGENFFNTGFTQAGFPSFGAWVIYALGTMNQELPAFVSINDPRGIPRSGKNNWGSGFLPAAFQGTDFHAGRPPANLKRPKDVSASSDRTAVNVLQRLNAEHLKQFPGDADLAGRIASYELAGRMQTSIPEVMRIDNEPKHMLRAYAADSKNKVKQQYARNCILARRLIERGVRCVQLFNGAASGNGTRNWDSHNNIESTHAMQAEIMDQPTAALISDLKQRGLLEDTLVVWCTEFGRMPFLQANGTGRDHNNGAFTCFLTGAGVKRGFSYGVSDDFGFKSAENETSIYDFNATLLHLLGLDHERLTYYHNGLERRLTNVHGHVVTDVLA